MTKEEINTYKREFNKKNFTALKIQFSNKNDADIIEKLGSVGSKVEYIRKLIREDIAKNK